MVDQCTEVRRTSKAIIADKTKTILEKKKSSWGHEHVRGCEIIFFLFFFGGGGGGCWVGGRDGILTACLAYDYELER